MPRGPGKNPEIPEVAPNRGVVSAKIKDVVVEVAGDLANGPDQKETGDKFDKTNFDSRFSALKKLVKKVLDLAPKEREKYVKQFDNLTLGVEYYLNDLRENEHLYSIEGHDVYLEKVKSSFDPKTVRLSELTDKVDLTEVEVFLEKAKKGMRETESFVNLERMRNTIKPKDFLKWRAQGKGEEMLKVISNVTSWQELKKEKLVVFNFGNNAALEFQVGLGDVMPPKVRKVSVNGDIYERRGNQGFFRNGRYLAIFSGTNVKVEEVDENYAAKVEKNYIDDFGDKYNGADEKIENLQVTKKDVLQVAKDFRVDASLLEAVMTEMDGSKDGVLDDFEFLHLAAKYMQNAQVKYRSLRGTVIEFGHYKVDFIAYALDRFNLYSVYSGRSSKAEAVVKKYAALRGIKLEFDQEVRARRSKEVSRLSKPGVYEGESYYNPADILKAREGMTEAMEERLRILKGELLADSNFPKEFVPMAISNARKMYEAMIIRQGERYKDKVLIKKRRIDKNGNVSERGDWSITNSCVGHMMKVLENTDFFIRRGRQAGKAASNHVWAKIDGRRDSFYKGIVEDDSMVKKVEGIDPGNIDQKVGSLLKVGEPAVATLWDHTFVIYKNQNGTIMMNSSGADVRPQRISVSEVVSAPPGYEQRGAYYVKKRGSKVSELPLGYFLAKKYSKYCSAEYRRKGLDFLRLVSLRDLVRSNVARDVMVTSG